MEKNTDYAAVTADRSLVRVLSADNCEVEILENGKTIDDVIESRIEEHSSVDKEEPFFVADLDSLLEKHVGWRASLPRVQPFYAVKCNNMPLVIQMLRALGTGFDCASKGEIQLALSLGVEPDKIIYANTTKPRSHIRYACAQGVELMTFDNEEELVKVSQFHPKAKLVLRVAVDDSESMVRLSSKFGARLDSVAKLLQRAAELQLSVVGVSFHVGSMCCDAVMYERALTEARHVFDMAKLVGFQMKLVDIGGGFSTKGSFQAKFQVFSEVINGALDKLFPPDSGVQVIAEPGRYFVESSFTLAATVIAKRVDRDDVAKHNNNGENRSDRMVYYINDGVYMSFSSLIYEPIKSIVTLYLPKATGRSGQPRRSVIWGPTCDSIDRVSEDHRLPELEVGDWLCFDHMGAYTLSTSTRFNGFDKPRVYPAATPQTWNALKLA